MNISSLIVYLKKDIDAVKMCENLAKFDGVEIVTHGDGKIVLTIESSGLDGELAVFKSIRDMKGVSDIAMIYSYQDLDDEISQAQNNDIAAIVRDLQTKDDKDIKYHGHPNV